MILHLLRCLAVEAIVDRHIGPVLAAGLEVVGQGLDAEGRVAGRVPVGAVPAVVEQVLDQPRGKLALGIGPGQQLEVERVGLDLAAVPGPPVTLVGQLEISRLVLVILHHVLARCSGAPCASLSFSPSFVQRQSEHGLGIDGEVRAIAIEKAEHRVVLDSGVDQNHEDERIEVVGGFLVRFDLADAVLEELDLLRLVGCQPGDAAFEHPSRQRKVVLPGDLKAVDNQRRGVGRGVLAESGEPAPAAVGKLHVGQALNAAAAIFTTSAMSKTGLWS